MADDGKFCVRCGATLPEGASFCGECGLSLEQGSSEPPHYESQPIGPNTKELGLVPACIIIYGIAISAIFLFVLYFMLNFDSFIQMLVDLASQVSGSEKQQILDMIDMLRSVYTADVRTLYVILSLLVIVSGVLAIISGYFANKYEKWKLSLILCIIATAFSVLTLGLISILLIAVGIYMSYRIYKAKDLFKS